MTRLLIEDKFKLMWIFFADNQFAKLFRRNKSWVTSQI